MVRHPPFLFTLLKVAVRSRQGKNETNAFSLSISQRGSPAEMPGTPCCFLHQQMADGCFPCVCFSFSNSQVTSGLASAWSKEVGVHILYKWLALKKRKKRKKECVKERKEK